MRLWQGFWELSTSTVAKLCAPFAKSLPLEPTGLLKSSVQLETRKAGKSAGLRATNKNGRLLLGRDGVLGSLGNTEFHYRLGLDLDGLTGLRIAPHACLAMRLH